MYSSAKICRQISELSLFCMIFVFFFYVVSRIHNSLYVMFYHLHGENRATKKSRHDPPTSIPKKTTRQNGSSEILHHMRSSQNDKLNNSTSIFIFTCAE